MILVTGATGLVGSHLLLHLLENEKNVCAIYRNKNQINKTKNLFDLYQKSDLFSKINWIKADITDVPSLEIAFRDVTFVYHCAAYISFDPKKEDQLRKNNIEGTANIVNFCLAKKIQKLCYVSSIAALGDILDHEKITTETTEWNPEKPNSDYAISKFGAEMEIWRAQQEGLQVVIVNPGVILGAGFMENGSGQIFSKVKNGLKYYTLGSTGFVSVWDLVKIMKLLMQFEVTGERFSVISENVTYKDLVFNIAEAYQVKPPKIYASEFMTNIASKLDWISSTVFGTERKLSLYLSRSLHHKEVISNKKISDLLHFEFEPLQLTIQKIVKLDLKK